MTTQQRETIIQAMCAMIVRTIDPQTVLLFGSYASGKATMHSDADFLVVEDGVFGPQKSRRKEVAKILKALLPFEISKDILLYSVDEVKNFKEDSMHVVGQAMKLGKVLYAKA